MKLPQISDCEGCGVCCLHMGFPTFMLPREPIPAATIDAGDEAAARLLAVGWTREELLAGHPGESYWQTLPDDLRVEWQEYVERYEAEKRKKLELGGEDLDSACFWFDMETRKCKHHLYRPRVCRDFEVGSDPCIEWRAEYEDLIANKEE